MSFLSSLFGGSNPTLNSQIGELGSIAGSATKTGQTDLSSASNFFNSLLTGGAAKTLAPQISSVQKQGQQQLQTLSQFGNRSGGTNAKAQTSSDTSRAQINDMIASLTGTAASNLGSLGTSSLGLGLGAYKQQSDASQLQMQNWQNSIFGQGISGGLGYLEGFGLGKV